MSNRLEGKVALVTGGGSGLGAAICRRFAEEGAVVFPADVNAGAAQAVHAECERLVRGGAALIGDVADSLSVRKMFAGFAERQTRLDVLVNNAGIGLTGKRASSYVALMARQAQEMATRGRIETHCDTTIDLGDEDWDRMLRIHLYGAFYCSREALRIMKEQGSGATSNGKIINMGSIMGTSGGAGAVDYCAAKAGIHGFTRALAREVASRNIQVNAIAPGFVDTPLLGDMHAAYPLIAAATPLGRLGKPDDVAWAAVYLASCEADWVTGQVLSPNGGWHMSQ
ncbi:MAG: 3-oxoacyl-ACP reductase FabG [Deltaproteobacteria bacterium]|nr:3-oxoacyl-ACP reductase FabG [Deltaproteobacteria bacterium]